MKLLVFKLRCKNCGTTVETRMTSVKGLCGYTCMVCNSTSWEIVERRVEEA